MSSKISSVVFSSEFLRQVLTAKLGDASQIEESNLLGVATQLQLVPTANVGTYTTQKGKAGMYLTTEAIVQARYGDGGVFTRIGEADEPIDVEKLKTVADAMYQRAEDLTAVISAVEESQNPSTDEE